MVLFGLGEFVLQAHSAIININVTFPHKMINTLIFSPLRCVFYRDCGHTRTQWNDTEPTTKKRNAELFSIFLPKDQIPLIFLTITI